MDAGEAFRQGLGSVNKARQARTPQARESSHESEDQSPKIAHTLAACCRCRQRKTRCDPTLPRCLPCERAGAQCEYFDTAKNKRMSRTYVIRLQDEVRSLQLKLAQLVEDESTQPDTEDSIRPGGLVRLEENDDLPRYLGPSSGIAMTRLVMEEARRYTDSRTIRELVPEVVSRRTPVQSPTAHHEPRKKSYPMISAVAADRLPIRPLTDKLVQVFNERAQYLFPTLHEPTFAQQVQDVYDGDQDPYKNFVLRMVLAISIQKLKTEYAGLADSYYLAAMSYVETVIRPKDLQTLQCLILIGQYSLLTPTRTAIYYIVGLATRLCQQLGLTEEKTIVQGVSLGQVDPLQMDMRRRLSWIVLTMEFGLAHSLGRPNGFATGQDHVDVGFFETVDDEYITANGILPGAPPSEKKIMAVHFLKMRLLQAEIRRVLYQRKRSEPKNDQHPWFSQMEKKLRDWLEAAPPNPSWSKPWFTQKLNTMLVMLFRPSPQVSKPSVRGYTICCEASAYNIRAQHKSMDNPTVDITWVFLQSLFMAVNTLLWTISCSEVRSQRTKEEFEELVKLSISVMERCTDRWPGTQSAAELYARLSTACLKAYEGPADASHSSSSLSANSPASLDANSPMSEQSNTTATSIANSVSQKSEPPPAFSYVFNQSPNNFAATEYHNSLQFPPQPTFRSNSIFVSPSSRPTDRRFSYFPPDFTQQQPEPSQHQPQQQTQQQPMPPAWDPSNVPSTNPSLSIPTSSPIQNFTPLDENQYFIQPTYNFGPQIYSEQTFEMPDRMGSLSYSQQAELMQDLETDGMSGIDSYLGLAPPNYFSQGGGGSAGH